MYISHLLSKNVKAIICISNWKECFCYGNLSNLNSINFSIFINNIYILIYFIIYFLSISCHIIEDDKVADKWNFGWTSSKMPLIILTRDMRMNDFKLFFYYVKGEYKVYSYLVFCFLFVWLVYFLKHILYCMLWCLFYLETYILLYEIAKQKIKNW